MASTLKAIWNLLKSSVNSWIDDKAPRLGAALSFYTAFAIPPLVMIAISIASLVFNPEAVRSQMFSEVSGLIGQKASHTIESAMAAQYQSDKGIFASAAAIITLIITATGLFIELQDALNTIWKVEPKPGHGVMGFIRIRLMSFAMIVGIAFLLLVSLIISAALAAVSNYINELFPAFGVLSSIANGLVSFLVITVLFALIFKILPDVKIAWRDVWIGAAVTSLLFTAGKFLLAWYLGKSKTVSAYGAAGSMVLILLWVYYSAQILFFGAEVTKVYATRFGAKARPASYARWAAPVQNSARSEERTKPVKSPEPMQFDDKPNKQEQLISELREEVESLRAMVHH